MSRLPFQKGVIPEKAVLKARTTPLPGAVASVNREIGAR